MSGTWEATHVRADLGDDGRSSHRSGRGPGQEELHGFFLLDNQSANIDLHPVDRPLQVIEVVEQFANQQLVMCLDSPVQRQTQRGQLFAEPSFGQLSQDLRVGLALLNGREHTSATDPNNITGHRAQFDIGCLQHLVNAINLLGARLDEVLAIPCQISQDPDRGSLSQTLLSPSA